jgi:predicted GNAT family N-acyltransferase
VEFLIRSADFAADFSLIRSVRYAVFVDEQHVPEDVELDDRDPYCRHFLALARGGAPVGTARIDLESGKVGRLAVLAPYRSRGIGRALMQACHELAGASGIDELWCNAQLAAMPFYERLGYSVTGGTFDEAGIEHVRMIRPL